MLDGAVLNALADPRRRAILRLVRDVERPSGEIAAHFPEVTGPAISQMRLIFRFGLLRAAYTREALLTIVARSRFGDGELIAEGIGFELRLAK